VLVAVLPTVNAGLNAVSASLLVAGYACIRRKRVDAHRRCMLAAFVTSVIFLGSYLVLRYLAGVTRFPGEGWIRPVYFTVLLSHTVLAAGMLPLILVTLARALRGHFTRHARIARWTLPIWVYVSVTGVMVYWMLYRL
jgi:uncharacterized membrane protein YozB (DUF420 family)